ncbi:MAG: dTDP-4-dehydrorhamnose 3,5-epimerase [Desulfatiglandaceae bacterium]
MKVIKTSLAGVLAIEPDIFEDDRGYFLETYQEKRYREIGIDVRFVQDNLSYSRKGTLRGLHFQHPRDQAKLVQVIQGNVYDVVVDIRKGSPTYGKWTGVELSGENKRQFFIPPGFAHGFCVMSESAVFSYRCSDYYSPESEVGILWSDPDIGIDWPVTEPLLSKKDREYPRLKDVPESRLPVY